MTEKSSSVSLSNWSVLAELHRFAGYFRIPTFQAIVLQGVVGAIPGKAFGFATMYLQYVGFADGVAGLMSATNVVGAACGCVLGGYIGDRLTAKSPNHGRPMTAQISVFLSIPFALALFKALPRDTLFWPAITVLMFGLGLFSSWCKTGCNQPIFLEIVSPTNRASAFSLEYGIEGLTSYTIGPVAVAMLSSKVFGYQLEKQSVATMSSARRLSNADALGNSLALCMVAPWVLCFAIYTALHHTYKMDRAAAAKFTEETPLMSQAL